MKFTTKYVSAVNTHAVIEGGEDIVALIIEAISKDGRFEWDGTMNLLRLKREHDPSITSRRPK